MQNQRIDVKGEVGYTPLWWFGDVSTAICADFQVLNLRFLTWSLLYKRGIPTLNILTNHHHSTDPT